MSVVLTQEPFISLGYRLKIGQGSAKFIGNQIIYTLTRVLIFRPTHHRTPHHQAMARYQGVHISAEQERSHLLEKYTAQ